MWAFLLSVVVVVAISCGMTCCFYERCKKYPLNYILLAIYCVAHTYLIAAVCARYNEEIALAAAACTMGMFLALTVYACFTKTDITYMGGTLSSATMMLLIFAILFSWFTRKNSILYLIFICLFIVLLSVWIVYDT